MKIGWTERKEEEEEEEGAMMRGEEYARKSNDRVQCNITEQNRNTQTHTVYLR